MARKKAVEKVEAEGRQSVPEGDTELKREQPPLEEAAESEKGRRVVTTVEHLRVRTGVGKHNRDVAVLHEPEGEKKEHCIIKEKKGWGLLAEYKKLENGWIDLKYTRAVE